MTDTISTSTSTAFDTMDHLAGVAAGGPVAQLRAARPEVVRASEASDRALLVPDDLGGVSVIERAMIAYRVGLRTPSAALAQWHGEQLRALGVSDATLTALAQFPDANSEDHALTPRLRTILSHADRITDAPGAATAADIAALKAAGLTPREIVTVSQLIAYLSYAARMIVGLRLLAPDNAATDTGALPQTHGPRTVTPPPGHFTIDVLTWHPWLETVDDTGATPEQEALVSKVAPSPESRPYYALLAHDPLALVERTALFNAIMYGAGGAKRADRELAAAAGSRVNGCVYCTSVHARRYAQLTKDTETITRLLDEGVDTTLPPHERAIVDYAVALTATPETLTPATLAPLRAEGFTDAEILDITGSVAMFAWANRLMQTIGEGAPTS